MKNRMGFYVKSSACKEAEELGKKKIAIKCTESDAWRIGVEWHHGGSGIIAFFPKNEEEEQRVASLKSELKNRTIKTKKAALEYLESASGDYKIPYKMGKYGKFFSFWGEADGELSIDSDDENLPIIKELLGI